MSSRSYDAKKDDKFTYYFYSLPYKKCFSWYTHLSHFYLRDNSNKHLAVIAPTRSGKGVGLIVPTLLGGWKASTIVNDIKSENWGITAGYRHYRMGQKTIKFRPTADDGSSARWNPLDEIRIGDPWKSPWPRTSPPSWPITKARASPTTGRRTPRTSSWPSSCTLNTPTSRGPISVEPAEPVHSGELPESGLGTDDEGGRRGQHLLRR